MLSEVGPLVFYGQKFEGIALPEVGDVSEETRIRAAATGVYELWFRQQPQYQFTGALVFNDEKPDLRQSEHQQTLFEVSEVIAGMERTLTVQITADGINLDTLEIIPLDWREDPVEFTLLEASESRRTISYRKNVPVESLKFKLSGVNVFEIEIINAVLQANGRDYSPGKLSTFFRRSDEIRIDKLTNSPSSVGSIEDHLSTFFRLLLEKAPNRIFDYECNYRYQIADGGPNAFVPVFFSESQSLPTATESFSKLYPILTNWYQNFSPPAGVFDFGVK